jgi:hypothetical protein
MNLSRITLLLLLGSLFGFALLPAPAYAITDCVPGTYAIGSRNANGRAGATTEARILVVLRPGTQVQVTGERLGIVVDGSGIWCEATVNGQFVVIHSGALVASSGADTGAASGPAVGDEYVVNGTQAINARTTPHTNSPVAVVLQPGTTVTLLGTANGNRVNGSGLWYQVSYNGRTMYVHSTLVQPTGGVAPVQPPAADAGQPQPGAIIPLSGNWHMSFSDTALASCVGTETISFPIPELNFLFTGTYFLSVARDGSSIDFGGDILTRTSEPNSYLGSVTLDATTNGQTYLTAQSPTSLTGRFVTNLVVDNTACSATVTLTLTRV